MTLLLPGSSLVHSPMILDLSPVPCSSDSLSRKKNPFLDPSSFPPINLHLGTVSLIMNPIRTREDLFRIYLHDYLKKRGLHHTAEIFRREAQVSRQPPAEFDLMPHGFLRDWWVSFYDMYNSRQQMPGSSSQANVGTIWDDTPQIFREGYSLQLLGGFPSNNVLSSCHFSSDGKIVASGGLEKKVFLCYMETCDSVTTLEGHSDPISEVRFQPGSTIFATSSSDKTVKLWDATKPGNLLFNLIGHNGLVRSLDFHPTEEVLCSSDSFDVIELWNVNQCVRLKNFMAGGQQVRFQPRHGRFLAVANGAIINILDIQSWGVQNRLQGHVNEVRSICWDTAGQMLASVSEDSARVWSIVVCGYCLHELPANGKRFQSIIFHPRYPNVLVIGGFQCLELWIPESGQMYNIPAHNGSITGLAASTENEFIASASSDSMVKIWK